MPERTYKVIEIVGTSEESSDGAIRNALSRTGRTLQNLDWFEVLATRGRIESGRAQVFQVTLKVGFRLADEQAPMSGYLEEAVSPGREGGI